MRNLIAIRLPKQAECIKKPATLISVVPKIKNTLISVVGIFGFPPLRASAPPRDKFLSQFLSKSSIAVPCLGKGVGV